ncbi:winged helix-turn-helix transcriptional regulator [Devosia sp. SL43]|uniref:winged helix-turn-helix transcriptional regulator n=1 Tax=Devosia sp. SL43 TaxID=2806348 RepID=UPI001F48F0B7|nr:helix-turn-helix domain-containing protein [Devosia sp. SL43]UJW86657.1 helix-turn-helix transcriptional regulator [Devosia sp. SL43]
MTIGDNSISHDCRPVSEILNQIGGKWAVLIINLLSDGPMRFSAIRRMIGGISQKVLTATLRELEMDGFVTRTVTPSIPPRVDYELTELGRDLQRPLKLLGAWAVDNRPKVLEARARYFAEHPDAMPQRKGRIAPPQHLIAAE